MLVAVRAQSNYLQHSGSSDSRVKMLHVYGWSFVSDDEAGWNELRFREDFSKRQQHLLMLRSKKKILPVNSRNLYLLITSESPASILTMSDLSCYVPSASCPLIGCWELSGQCCPPQSHMQEEKFSQEPDLLRGSIQGVLQILPAPTEVGQERDLLPLARSMLNVMAMIHNASLAP